MPSQTDTPGTGTPAELMNIREAAGFLNVSEVSLRRWTNDGKLPCLRVGGRKERRFRRDDLIAFLGKENETAIADTAPGKVRIEDVSIERGAHLCSLYKSGPGRLKISVPFLAAGLNDGEFCILVASPDAEEHILTNLRTAFPETDRAIADGRLWAFSGESSGDKMYRLLEKRFVEALAHGFTAMRLVGDMHWAIDNGISADELLKFEQRYNHDLAQCYPIVSLCLYDSRRFSGEVIHRTLLCHEDTFNYTLSRFL